ncbi:hypothetical protein [Photobacterium sp. 53610]|uniref:hypothetical protein n=1 Tax=Photobacterium sp. 53610 TaxID=3102789 RepID=UPI002ED94C5C
MRIKYFMILAFAIFSAMTHAAVEIREDGFFIDGKLVNENIRKTMTAMFYILSQEESGPIILERDVMLSSSRESCIYQIVPGKAQYLMDVIICTDSSWSINDQRFNSYMYAYQFTDFPIESFDDLMHRRYESPHQEQSGYSQFQKVPVLSEQGLILSYLERCVLPSKSYSEGLMSFEMEELKCDDPAFQFNQNKSGR